MANITKEEAQGLLNVVKVFGHGLNSTNSVAVLEALIELQAKFDRVVSCR